MLLLKDKHSEIINRATFCRVELRPYQHQALENILRLYLEEGRSRLMLQVATGGGKTVIFAYLSFLLNVPSLILAHSEELVQQAIDKIRQVWPQADIGRVQGNFNELGHQITVATIQTLNIEKRFRQLFPDRTAINRIGFIVIDEAHGAHSTTYRKLLMRFNLLPPNKAEQTRKVNPGGSESERLSGPLLLGVTATPERSDKASIGDIFTEFAYQWTIKDGITQGYLCDLRGYVLQFENDEFKKVKTKKGDGDYIPSQLEKAINRVARSEAIVQAWQEQAKGRPTIVFCVSIRHAQMLKRVFTEAGVKAGVLYSGMEPEERRQVLEDLKHGRLEVVTNCLILAEGFDCPLVSCVVIARPTRSRSLYAQMLGRGTRLSPETGKSNLLVLDVVDIFRQHNLNAPVTLGEVVGLKPEQNGMDDGNIESVLALLEQDEQAQSAVSKAELLRGRKGKFDEVGLLNEAELGREVSGGDEFDPLADRKADLAEARLHWVVGLGGYTLALPQPRNITDSRHYVLVVRRESRPNCCLQEEETANRVKSEFEAKESKAARWHWDIVHVVQQRQFDEASGRFRWLNNKEKLVDPTRTNGFESGTVAIREAEDYAFRITGKYYNLAKLKARTPEALIAEGRMNIYDRNNLPLATSAQEAATPAQLATLKKLGASGYEQFQPANAGILFHPAALQCLTKREAGQLIEDLITAQVHVGEDVAP